MKKYLKNTNYMSLDKKISWVLDKVPYILLSDMHIDISDVNDIVDNDGDTLCILENEYRGNSAAKKSIESTIDLLDTDIKLLKSTNSILVVLTIPPDYIFEDDPLYVIETLMPYKSASIFGISTNNTFSKNHVKATMVFLGSEK